MDLLNYQRTVFAFHGCDRRLRDAVLTGKKKLTASLNTYDWLGSGIYFWEHSPSRALEWAMQQSKRKGTKLKAPAVVGAIIQLGNCFDLLDIKFTQTLPTRSAELISELADAGLALPANQKAGGGDFDWLRREGDCFVLNSVIPTVEADWDCQFQSVRGVFQEGAAVFKGAGIKLKSHIQIAVRDPRAIIGYFTPKAFSPLSIMKTTTTSTKQPKASLERRGYPFVSIDELERRSAPRRARERVARRGKSPEEVRASLIARGILTKDGKLPRYPMNHVPLGPRE